MLRMRRLHAEGERSDRIVHYAGDTQQQYTGSTERQAQTGAPVAAEGRDGVFAGGDEHGFDYQQVVVERDHRIEQGDENQQVESAAEGGRKDESKCSTKDDGCAW